MSAAFAQLAEQHRARPTTNGGSLHDDAQASERVSAGLRDPAGRFRRDRLWHYLDYFVYRTLYLDASKNIQLTDNILLIDLPYRSNDNDNDPTEYRLRLADLLGVIAASERERPQAVILDIWISNDARGLAELTDAIKAPARASAGPVDVYASFNPRRGGKQNAEQLWKEHAQDLYRSRLDGLWTYVAESVHGRAQLRA